MSEPRSPDEAGELFHANLEQQKKLRMALRQLEIEKANLMAEVRPQLSKRAYGHWMSSNSKGHRLSQPKAYKHRRIAEHFGYDWHGMTDDTLFFLTQVEEGIRHTVVEMFEDVPKPTKKRIIRAVESLTSDANQQACTETPKPDTPSCADVVVATSSAGEPTITSDNPSEQAPVNPPPTAEALQFRKNAEARLLHQWFTASVNEKQSFILTIIEQEGPTFVASMLNLFVNLDNPGSSYQVLCTEDGFIVGEEAVMLHETQEYFGTQEYFAAH